MMNLNKNTLRELVANYIPINEQERIDQKTMLGFIDSFDDVVTRNNIFGHFTASAFVVNRSMDQVVILKHNIFGDCVYLGGHADGDYDLLGVALREVEEETGLVASPLNNGDVFSLQCIPVKGHTKKGQYISPHVHHDLAFLFVVDDDKMDAIRVLESENSEVMWIPIYESWLDGMADWFQHVYIKFKEKLGGSKDA